jgi:hypothetical protein
MIVEVNSNISKLENAIFMGKRNSRQYNAKDLQSL